MSTTPVVPTRRRRRLLALLTAGGLVLAACGNSGDDDSTTDTTDGGQTGTTAAGEAQPIEGVPGVTDDEIRYAVVGIRSNNPLGTCVLDCYIDGIEAYFAFRNSQGGVDGRQLVLSTVLDDELTNNQVRSLEVISANDTFGAFGATQLASGWADLAEAGIPLYVWGIHFNEMAGQESIFGYTGVRCGLCTWRFPVYAATMAGASRVATVGYGISQTSKDCSNSNVASVELYGEETGLEVAYSNDELDFGLPNGIAPEVTAMKDAGVDFIVGCIDLNGMKTLAQELERQGMGDVPMFHPNTYDADFVAEAGDLFEGDYVGVLFRPFEADPGDSAQADFLEWMEETGSEVTELAMIGWINADTAYQGLVEAGPQFDRASVIAATNSLTAYTAGGLIPPIDWSRQHEAPTQDDPVTHGYAQECFSYVQVRDGAFEMVGDPERPFYCWDGADRAWAEPTPTAFD